MQNPWFPGVTFPFSPYGSSGPFPMHAQQPAYQPQPQPVYYAPPSGMRLVAVGHSHEAGTGLPWGEIVVTAALSAFAGVVFGRMFDRLL